jgi:hypothetical protein
MHATQTVVAWQIAIDHRNSFKPNVQGDPASDVNFATLYAPDTTQNNPNAPGVFHFWLKRGFDTSRYANGDYLLEVEVSDVRGNPNVGKLTVTFANA